MTRANVPTTESIVDFPDPFGPVTTDTAPGSNRALTPTSARTGPYVFVTDRSSTLTLAYLATTLSASAPSSVKEGSESGDPK